MNDLTPGKLKGSRMRKSISLEIIFAEKGSGSNINNELGNVLVISLLRWNGEEIEEKEGDQNGSDVQENEYIKNEVN